MSGGGNGDDEVDHTQYSLPPIVEQANEGVLSERFLHALDKFGDAKRLSDADLAFIAECRSDPSKLSRYLRPCPEVEINAVDVQNFVKFVSGNGSPEFAMQQFINEWTAAMHDNAHRLSGVVSAKINGASEQEIEELLCPILADALRNTQDPLNLYALMRLVAPAYMIQTAANIPFLRDRGMDQIVQSVSVAPANEVAHSRRVIEKSHRDNKKNATSPRSKKWWKALVIQDMRRARRRNASYAKWLGGILDVPRPGADFELVTDKTGNIFFVDPDGVRYPINEAAMSSTWWAEAGKTCD